MATSDATAGTANPSRSQSHWEKVKFNGEGMEYFKIWIVNIFLSILTLGIFSAWAKVRTRRYFYGNTVVAGSVFEYHATPIAILKGRLIAVAVLILAIGSGYFHPLAEVVFFVLIALLTPWAIWRSIIFNARMSSYRNVRFSFRSSAWKPYLYLLIFPLLPLAIAGVVIGLQFTLGMIDLSDLQSGGQNPKGAIALGGTIGVAVLAIYLLIPYIQKALTSYYFNGHMFGQGKFHAKLEASTYYLIYLKLLGIGLLFWLVIAIIFGLLAFLLSMTDIPGILQDLQAGTLPGPGSAFGLLIFIPFFAVFAWFKAYTESRFRNYSMGQLKLDRVAAFRSRLKVNKLAWIQFSNILLLICTLGLAYPWAIIRLTRYKTSTLDVRVFGDVDQYITQLQSRESALGEEIGEAFDLGLDLGI